MDMNMDMNAYKNKERKEKIDREEHESREDID